MQANSNLIWILAANSSEARLYATKYLGQELILVKEYLHPETRLRASELVTDKPGAMRQGAFVEEHNPKEVEVERFAHILAEELDRARNHNSYGKLIIIAPPHFQGLLNKRFNQHVLNKIIHSIDKDYTKVPVRELSAYLDGLPRV